MDTPFKHLNNRELIIKLIESESHLYGFHLNGTEKLLISVMHGGKRVSRECRERRAKGMIEPEAGARRAIRALVSDGGEKERRREKEPPCAESTGGGCGRRSLEGVHPVLLAHIHAQPYSIHPFRITM